MIFLDANVFMYAAGASHTNKAASAELLEAVGSGALEATTSVEILQEILHRYRALDRWEDGRRLYDLARRLLPAVVAVTVEMTDRARVILDEHSGLMARDALHAATCERIGATALCSYDTDFDMLPGLRRATPEQVLSARADET